MPRVRLDPEAVTIMMGTALLALLIHLDGSGITDDVDLFAAVAFGIFPL